MPKKGNTWRSLFSVGIDLENDEPFLDEDDLNEVFAYGIRGPKNLLGDYREEDIWENFELYGITPKLHSYGFNDLKIVMDTSDPFVHRLCVTDSRLEKLPDGSNFIIDIRLRRKEFSFADFKSFVHDKELKEVQNFLRSNLPKELHLTVLEWMCMQNPLAEFEPNRPQLSGQRHPGMGIGNEVLQMLGDLGTTHGRDGLLNIPDYFHNGIMYLFKGFSFLNPAYQGFIIGLVCDLRKDLVEMGLSAVSWAVGMKLVKNKKTGKRLKWKPQEQIFPTSERMKNLLGSKEYLTLVKQYVVTGRFVLSEENTSKVKSFIAPSPKWGKTIDMFLSSYFKSL